MHPLKTSGARPLDRGRRAAPATPLKISGATHEHRLHPLARARRDPRPRARLHRERGEAGRGEGSTSETTASRLIAGDRRDAQPRRSERGLWLPHMPEGVGRHGPRPRRSWRWCRPRRRKSGFGPFALNAQAPDEGNMHTLLHWGTDEQKEKYLKPLCDGIARVVLRDDRARGRRLRPDADPDARRTRTATSGSSTATSGSSAARTARSSRS